MNNLLDLRIRNDRIEFVPQDTSVQRLGFTDYTPQLWQMLTAKKWRIKRAKGKPKYIYSGSHSLHHFVLDYYWGAGAAKAANDRGMIVEHLNNNGFDCTIQNLFILNKIKNTNKGFYFDPLVQKMIPIVALRLYHVLDNKTFQIVICFNKSYVNPETGGRLRTIKLLYPYNYDIVLQDAETILEFFEDCETIEIQELLRPLRFQKARTQEDHIPNDFLTQEVQAPLPGSIITHNGQVYIVPGRSGDRISYLISSPYDEDWNL